MSIQSGINQILSSAGVMSSLGRQAYQQSDIYQSKTEAKKQQQQFEEAAEGIKDIYGNITGLNWGTGDKPEEDVPLVVDLEGTKKEPKKYSDKEYENISSRLGEHLDKIYDAKTRELNPRYSKYMDTSSFRQSDISPRVQKITEAIKNAKESLAANGQAKIDSNERLANTKELLTRSEAKEKFKESGAPGRTTNKILNRMERAGMLKGGNDGTEE